MASPGAPSIIQYPYGFRDADVRGYGVSGIVVRLDAVVKCALPGPGCREDLERERRVYEALNPFRHRGLLRYYGHLPGGALLLEYAPHKTIRHQLVRPKMDIPFALRSRWIRQIAETVAFVHSQGILHADIACNNIFLDDQQNTKVGDFAGASIDGEEARGCYDDGYSHPRDDAAGVSVRSEVFALGSTFYEIMTGAKPYQGHQIHEVEEAFRQERYPDLSSLPAYGHIIERCWKGDYSNVDEMLPDITADGTASHCSRSGPLANTTSAPAIPETETLSPSISNAESTAQPLPTYTLSFPRFAVLVVALVGGAIWWFEEV